MIGAGGTMFIRRNAALAIAAITIAAAAWADTTGTLTLAGLSSLDLDTGTTSSITGAPTGDLFWTGTTLAPAASGVTGVLLSQTGQTSFDALTQAQLAAITIPASGGTFTSANGL